MPRRRKSSEVRPNQKPPSNSTQKVAVHRRRRGSPTSSYSDVKAIPVSAGKLRSIQGLQKVNEDRKLNGYTPDTPGTPVGKRLITRIREMLQERSLSADGRYNTRFDDAANAFVEAMEAGSYVHLKEFLDREEGKVPQRLTGVDASEIKIYVGIPIEGSEAP